MANTLSEREKEEAMATTIKNVPSKLREPQVEGKPRYYPNARLDDTATLDGKSYVVVKVESDGTVWWGRSQGGKGEICCPAVPGAPATGTADPYLDPTTADKNRMERCYARTGCYIDPEKLSTRQPPEVGRHGDLDYHQQNADKWGCSRQAAKVLGFTETYNPTQPLLRPDVNVPLTWKTVK